MIIYHWVSGVGLLLVYH